MAHFAELDNNNIVIRATVVNNDVILDENGIEQESIGIEFLKHLGDGLKWIQTSYNESFRKNFAFPGYLYDEQRDAFIPPQPYSKWILNEETCKWECPVPHPDDTENPYIWNDELSIWEMM